MDLPKDLTPEQEQIRKLSDRIVKAQSPIRVLDAIKWNEAIKEDFFKHKCNQLPAIDQSFYQPLPFDGNATIAEFRTIIREINNQLGRLSGIARIMVRMCEEYCKAVQMLQARGTPLFAQLAMELYGAPDDAFYPGGPRLSELGTLLGEILQMLKQEISTDADEKRYTAEEAVALLKERLGDYFYGYENVLVTLSDNIIADAAAGASSIKLNQGSKFSDRDLRYLEVHEAWVHVGTSLNGARQPICTFLAKGSPSASVTQEGLAVITEVFTFSSNPRRMLKITNRVKALELVTNGANFLDVFRFFREQGLEENDSYNATVRVFRGSTPTGGAFTKDLSYAKGFILIYNYIRLAVKRGLIDHVPMFFVGKTLIEDIPLLRELHKQGLIIAPTYLPPIFKDLAAISAWMSFSLYLNKFNLEKVAEYYNF